MKMLPFRVSRSNLMFTKLLLDCARSQILKNNPRFSFHNVTSFGSLISNSQNFINFLEKINSGLNFLFIWKTRWPKFQFMQFWLLSAKLYCFSSVVEKSCVYLSLIAIFLPDLGHPTLIFFIIFKSRICIIGSYRIVIVGSYRIYFLRYDTIRSHFYFTPLDTIRIVSWYIIRFSFNFDSPRYDTMIQFFCTPSWYDTILFLFFSL
jgi:hypothetical protein